MALGDGITWDESTPTDATTANTIDDYNRDLRKGVRNRMALEHEWPSSQSATSEGGVHKYISFQSQASVPVISGTQLGSVYMSSGNVLMFSVGTTAGTQIVPFVATAGSTIQVVSTQVSALATGTTQTPCDDSIPQITEGNEYMTLAVTPTSATNMLKVDVVFGYADSVTDRVVIGLFQGTTANAIAAVSDQRGGANEPAVLSFSHYVTAGTTGALTFSVRAGGQGGTISFNGLSGSRILGGVYASSMTITEIKV